MTSKKRINENEIMNCGEIQFIYDINSEDCKKLIETTINVNGFAPEHNYEYFISHYSDESKPIFVYFGNSKGLFALQWDDGCWQIISEILAPENERADLFIIFSKEVFENKNCKKIFVEFPVLLRKEIMKKVKEANKTAETNKINSITKTHDILNSKKQIVVGTSTNRFYIPIVDLKQWTPSLDGPEFSKLRKAKNRFFRNFKVEILKKGKILDVPFEEFEKLIKEWKKSRKSKDRAYYEDYLNFFKNKFKGSAVSLVLKLNDQVCGVASAWIVPNTHGKTVYYGISLHNYSVPELGDFLNVLFLTELKEEGFEFMDFGSSDEKLLQYKKKFKPFKQTEVVCFYVRYEGKK